MVCPFGKPCKGSWELTSYVTRTNKMLKSPKKSPKKRKNKSPLKKKKKSPNRIKTVRSC